VVNRIGKELSNFVISKFKMWKIQGLEVFLQFVAWKKSVFSSIIEL
jgi:hypothetical protein